MFYRCSPNNPSSCASGYYCQTTENGMDSVCCPVETGDSARKNINVQEKPVIEGPMPPTLLNLVPNTNLLNSLSGQKTQSNYNYYFVERPVQ